MEKLDLNDKFLHGVNCEHSEDTQIVALESILKSGYLMSPRELCGDSDCIDKIFLSVHPRGVFKEKYTSFKNPDDSFFCYANDGYMSSVGSFILVLNSKLEDDYKIEICNLNPHELLVPEKIEVLKYLEGIANAGLIIDPNLLCIYYIQRYLDNEMSFEDMLSSVRETVFYSPVITTIEKIGNDMTKKSRLRYYTSIGPSALIGDCHYLELKWLLEDLDLDIGLYDRFGNPINDKIQTEKVEKMQEYLRNKKVSCDDINQLLEDVKKYYKKM